MFTYFLILGPVREKKLVAFIGFILGFLCLLFASPSWGTAYTFGSGRCKIQGTWTEDALNATQELLTITEGLKRADGCGDVILKIESYLQELRSNLKSLDTQQEASNQISNLQDEILMHRQYSQNPDLRSHAIRSMVSGMNELAALSISHLNPPGNTEGPSPSSSSPAEFLPNLGDRVFRVSHSGINIANQLLEAITSEQMKCLNSPNLMAPFFTSLVQLSAAMVSSGQDFFGKDISLFVSKITTLARNTHFDRIAKDLNWAQYQNSMSCLLDTLSEGYCSTLDAQLLFNEEMKRLKPISWTWDTSQTVKSWSADTPVSPGDFDKLKRSVFEGYYVLTQQVPVVTAFLERIQRGIPPKNQSDANFQNTIQSNTFGYFINERNIVAEWNTTKTTIANTTNIESQKASIADALKKLARLIIGESSSTFTGINFLERVTNYRKVIFQLMGKEIPPDVIGQNGMQIRAPDWLDAHYQSFIGNPTVAMVEISKNLDLLLASANQAAVEYYNYWFIADQPGLMIDSLTGMTYNIAEALEGINQYLGHFAKESYVDASILPAVYETIEKINRILAQYKLLRQTGLELKSRYGNLEAYPIEERKQLLAQAISQYKELIEIFYTEFIILKARSSFLVNRLTSFVKIDYQRRLRESNSPFDRDQELLKQIYYATGDVVFERMRLISSKNPAEIDADLNFAQRTYLQSLRSAEDLIRDNFAASIAQLRLEIDGADTTTAGIFEDSVVRVNRSSMANYYHQAQVWFFDRLYEGLPEFLRPASRRKWNYYTSDKIYGITQMLINPDLYPGIYALNPLRLITKGEAPGIVDNANGAVAKTLGILCIQSLALRDPTPFYSLCENVVLQSPMIDKEMRKYNPEFPYYDFLDVKYKDILQAYYQAPEGSKKSSPQLFPDLHEKIDELSLRRSKNFDARICALRQRNRNNYIMFLTQGKHIKADTQ